VRRLLAFPFSPVENVLVQSVAGAVGTMPLGCGFVAVIPALEYLLLEEEGGPLRLSLGRLVVWAVGICFFGVVFAVPLRRQVIIRERLKFPSGTATALMIGVLHGDKGDAKVVGQEGNVKNDEEEEERPDSVISSGELQFGEVSRVLSHRTSIVDDEKDWMAKIRLLLIAFGCSAFYVRDAASKSITKAYMSCRHSSPTSSLIFVISRSLVLPSPQIGSGRSIHHQPMSVKVSSWARRRRYTCCSVL
jgi:uncharacterized oligopeptide transporter (OPT) family protein